MNNTNKDEILEQVLPDGTHVGLGLQFASDEELIPFRSMEAIELVKRSDWAPNNDLHELVADRIKRRNQGSIPACGGFGTSKGMAIAQMLNDDIVEDLSPTMPYILAGGNGRNGTVVTSLLSGILKYGCCLESDLPYSNRFSMNLITDDIKAKAEARIPESYEVLDTFDEAFSCSMRGEQVVFGILVGGNFNADKQGNVNPYDGGGGGHCMCAFAPGYNEKRKMWGLWTDNSWGASWGMNGMAMITEDYFNRSLGMFQAFRVKYRKRREIPVNG